MILEQLTVNESKPSDLTLDQMRGALYTAVVCDALDSLGLRHQSPRVALEPLTSAEILVGRSKTTLWAEMAHTDPAPYAKELAAVDGCVLDDVIVCAAHGSRRSGVWGELLSTAAANAGCVGAVVDGCVRDVEKMRAMSFPVFAIGTSPYDSRDRQRVVDIDVPVEIDGVTFSPGDLIFGDRDGVVVVPREIEREAIARAWKKVHEENTVRDEIQKGMKATDAFDRHGIL